MSKNLRDFTKALYGFDHVIRSVPGTAWDNPSPCEGWTARDVAGHAMGVVEMIGAAAQGSPPAHDFMKAPGPIAGANPLASWSAIRDSTLEALDRQGALRIVRPSAMGEQTVDALLGFILADTLIHTWDLARAVEGDTQLDDQLVELAYANMSQMAPTLAGSGVFKPTVEVPQNASTQAKLLGLTGRNPAA